MVIDPFVPGSTPLSTVIVTQSVAGQAGCEGCIAVTQYSVVFVTVALGLAMFGFDRPPAGLQVYVNGSGGQATTPLHANPVAGPFPEL